MRTAIIAAALSMTLAACSSPDAPTAPANDVAATPDAIANEVPPATEGNAMLPETPVPTPTAVAAVREFPAAFRGRWGINAADCDPARADNKGLITISADGIKFYESRARITTLTVASPTRISADLAFSGEGQTWQSRSVFDLSDGGRTLARSEESPAASYTYAKCPA